MYAWQTECLNVPGVKSGERNIVFTAPTSAGKSRVIDTLIAERLKSSPTKKVLVVTPFVALCSETAQRLASSLDLHDRAVCSAFGPQISTAALGAVSRVIVTTIESANILLNKAQQLADSLDVFFSCVVVDELHTLFDDRGHILETVLTQARLCPSIQLVCTAAFLPGAQDVARWLDAELYQTSTRPVPLSHHLVTQAGEAERYDPDTKAFTKLPERVSLQHLVSNAGGPVLVFCASKAEAQATAKSLAKDLPLRLPKFQPKKTGIPELDDCLAVGVGYHHADLPAEAKTIVESLLRQRVLRALCCTPTLAAGVNMPVRRVIILHGYVGINVRLSAVTYHQMAGRAGRASLDSQGDAFIFVCKQVPRGGIEALIRGDDLYTSERPPSTCDVHRLLLDLIVNGRVKAGEDISKLLEKMLDAPSSETVKTALIQLGHQNLVVWDEDGQRYRPTLIGRALILSGLPLKHATDVYTGMLSIRRQYVMSSDVQPALVVAQAMDARTKFDTHKALSLVDTLRADSDHKRALEVMGITEDILASSRYRFQVPYGSCIDVAVAMVRMLDPDTVKDMPATWKDAAIRKAGTVRDMAKVLGWFELAGVFDSFRKRLVAGCGIAAEFAGVPSITAGIAKKLRSEGIETLYDVAQASKTTLARVLHNDKGKAEAIQNDARVALLQAGHDALDSANIAALCPAQVRVDLVWSSTRDRQDRRVPIHVAFQGSEVPLGDVVEMLSALPPSTTVVSSSWKDLLVMFPELEVMTPRVQAQGVSELVTWAPLVSLAVAKAERTGLKILDLRAFRDAKAKAVNDMEDAERLATTMHPGLDISSHRSVAEHVLKDKKASTSKDVLKALPPAPDIDAILRYRYSKELLEALDGLARGMDSEGVVRTVFRGNPSGRITTETPNLQCVPKVLRPLLGPVRADQHLLFADYSHIELRVMAALSGDQALRALLSDRSNDPFGQLATQLSIERDDAKRLVYATVYGSQATLAPELREALERQFPTMMRWTKDVIRHAQQQGVVYDIFGRAREVVKARAKTAAVNAICQASCAGVLHRAIEALERELPGALVLPLHDEVMLALTNDQCDTVQKIMERISNDIFQGTPLFVKTKMQPTWT